MLLATVPEFDGHEFIGILVPSEHRPCKIINPFGELLPALSGDDFYKAPCYKEIEGK